MSIRDDNVQAIVDYFESGIKDPEHVGMLGIEIEHQVVDAHSQAVTYEGEGGVRQLLERLSERWPDKAYGDDGALIGFTADGDVVSIEPAAQLELSSRPYEYAAEWRQSYEAFQRQLMQLAPDGSLRAIAIGYHPTAKAEELKLIPKQRYRFMDEHFATIGPFGRYMMRGSAATQVSIDYYSTADCLRKLRIASALAPVFSLICDNTPTFEGAPRTHELMRTEIWQKCDPARCNTVPGVLDADFSLEAYANYILDTPAIFAYDERGEAYATEQTFGQVYASRPMSVADVEHALSLFFNDVRLKTYIEIRSADSMPAPFVAAYATLIKGLFYSEANLDELDRMLAGVGEADVNAAKEALMACGYEAEVYGMPAGELVDTLLDMARAQLDAMDASFLNPLRQLARLRKTLATMASTR